MSLDLGLMVSHLVDIVYSIIVPCGINVNVSVSNGVTPCGCCHYCNSVLRWKR